MINALLGIKQTMTSGYDSRGRRVGATVVQLGPNYVTQIKSSETKDGYNAVQLGFGTKKSVKKAQIGHAKKAGVDLSVRFFREIRVGSEGLKDLRPGQELRPGDIFLPGDTVKVTGVSKGHGFQGGVKRYNFRGGPKTHGQSDKHRSPGSIGSGTTPGRVYKGKRMAGHMGVETVSYKGLEVISVDKGKGLLTIKGSVPGFTGGLVVVQKLGRVKGYTPPPEPEEKEESSEVNKTEDAQNAGDVAEGGEKNAQA